jgi:CheY-like chemotaxis protein
MGGPVRLETPPGLLELTLAAGPIAPSGVVPCDGHVHEPLEEVALRRGCVPPLVLELLVRLEVRAGADQLEPFREPHALDYRPASVLLSGPVATILLVGVDLFFRGKLEALLPGHRFVTSDSVDPPDLVFADIARVDPVEVVDAWPDVPIVGFTNHTDKAGLQRAHAAGFDQVLVKSALVERAPALVAELVTVR